MNLTIEAKKTGGSPLVTVIIPAHNAAKFIEQTLLSVVEQTYSNLEIIVIDDGSTDNTADIVKAFAQQDKRIILLQQVNAGVAAARNLGIKAANGEFIAPVDADDVWFKTKIEKQVACFLNADLSVGLVYVWSVDISCEGTLTGGFHASSYEGRVYIPLAHHNFIGNGSAPLIRKSCFHELGGYNEEQLKDSTSHGSEDWDIYLRIAQRYEFRVVREILLGYRQDIASTSYKLDSMSKFYDAFVRLLKQRDQLLPQSVYNWSASNFYVYLAYKALESFDYEKSLSLTRKAFKLDVGMVLMRHDFYVLIIKNLFFQYFSSVLPEPKKRKPYSKSSSVSKLESLELKHIYKLIFISQCLPSKLYEKKRLGKTERSYSTILNQKMLSSL